MAQTKTARIADLEAQVSLLHRRMTDKDYMLNAYFNMLGPKGRQVAEMWQGRHTSRVHFDWTGKTTVLSGEERAEIILQWEAAPRKLMSDIDRHLQPLIGNQTVTGNEPVTSRGSETVTSTSPTPDQSANLS